MPNPNHLLINLEYALDDARLVLRNAGQIAQELLEPLGPDPAATNWPLIADLLGRIEELQAQVQDLMSPELAGLFAAAWDAADYTPDRSP